MDDRSAAFNGRRVLVTGGTGFLGSHLTRALHELAADVHVLTSRSTPPPGWEDDLHDAVQLHRGNLTDRDTVFRAVRAAGPQVVFHLGAFTHVGRSWSNTAECARINVDGTVNLLDAVEEHGYDRLVHVSTSDVYGDNVVPTVESATPRPVSPYAVSKLAAEMFCRLGAEQRGWPIVQLRACNAYGPLQPLDRVIPEIITRALDGADLEMTRGTQTREFCHVADLVDGFLSAAVVDGIDGEILNLGTGEEISIADLATTILRLMGDPITARLGALPERPAEVRRMCTDPSRARGLLGWSPTRSLREGLGETIEWYASELS